MPIAPLPSTGAVIGLDMGLKSFTVTSDGLEYPNHKFLTKSLRKLARLQRQLSRKSKGSKRREKARVKVARLQEHISNQRQDTLHNLNLTPGEYRDYYNIAIDVKDTAGPGGYEALDAFISTKSTGRESLSERLSRACADSARQVSSMELDIERSHQERSLGDAR